MTVDTTTGEIVETIGKSEARRLTTEAQNELRSSRDHFDKAWSLIEQAVSGGGHLDLGYRSPGDYLHAEFDGVLSGLDVAARRVAVRTLTDWGLSTRAIAPVVGVSEATAWRDTQAGASHEAPLKTPEPPSGEAGGSGQTPEGEERPEPEISEAESPAAQGADVRTPRPPVTGRDGKTYSRPEPKPAPTPAEVAEQDRRESVLRDRDRALSFIRGWSVGTRLIKGEHPHGDEILAALDEPYRDELARIQKEYLA